MSIGLQLRHEPGRHVDVSTNRGMLLWRYVYAPETPSNEARRPYAHPMFSLAGDRLTNFRPNDHPWHHALSFTITSVDGVNFWGGPSHRAADGYRWRDDHGEQRHRMWTDVTTDRMEEALDWCEVRSGDVLLKERRVLETSIEGDRWALRWTSEVTNPSARARVLGNYHSLGGLVGSHYTGLQFRGARDLLDDHGDAEIGVHGEAGLRGESGVHGTLTRWMEWACQHDGSLRRTRIRFESLDEPLSWFVRAKNPLAAFAFHRDQNRTLGAGETLRLDHRLTFTNA